LSRAVLTENVIPRSALTATASSTGCPCRKRHPVCLSHGARLRGLASLAPDARAACVTLARCGSAPAGGSSRLWNRRPRRHGGRIERLLHCAREETRAVRRRGARSGGAGRRREVRSLPGRRHGRPHVRAVRPFRATGACASRGSRGDRPEGHGGALDRSRR
jgi:hypothetical protein